MISKKHREERLNFALILTRVGEQQTQDGRVLSGAQIHPLVRNIRQGGLRNRRRRRVSGQ